MEKVDLIRLKPQKNQSLWCGKPVLLGAGLVPKNPFLLFFHMFSRKGSSILWNMSKEKLDGRLNTWLNAVGSKFGA